jgi:hypothetical protein
MPKGLSSGMPGGMPGTFVQGKKAITGANTTKIGGHIFPISGMTI